MIWTFSPRESVGKQCLTNCVLATVYAMIVPVGQWNTKYLDGILHAGHRLYLRIPKTHEYFVVTYIGNTVTNMNKFTTNIYKEMFIIFTEEIDTVISMKLSDVITSMTKENEWTYGILCTGHLWRTIISKKECNIENNKRILKDHNT